MIHKKRVQRYQRKPGTCNNHTTKDKQRLYNVPKPVYLVHYERRRGPNGYHFVKTCIKVKHAKQIAHYKTKKRHTFYKGTYKMTTSPESFPDTPPKGWAKKKR